MVNFVASLTAEAACEALRSAGMTCSAEDVQIVAREERCAVSLSGARIAWFPASELGNKRLAVWGLEGFEECELSENVLLFTQRELRNPYMSRPSNSVRIETHMQSRRQPLATEGYFPNYRTRMRGWNPNSKLFGKREVRLIALRSQEVAPAVFAAHFPNIFDTRSDFRISSPRDTNYYGLYATYPRTKQISMADGSLDFSGGSDDTG